jgi:hypothetical protein
MTEERVVVEVAEVMKGLDLAQEAVRRAGARGLRECAEDLLTEAKRLVPLDEGTLMESGTVDPASGVREVGDGMEVTVAFTSVYAARRHEETTARISRASEGRRSKYLETPAKERAPRYGKHIAERVREGMR